MTTFDDTSATPGTNYYYWVRSLIQISGTYYYSNFCTSDTGYALAVPPPVPTGLTASDGTYTNKVSLSWNDVAGEGGYQVYRNTVNNSATAAWLGLLGADMTSFDDTGATPGTNYYYWVRSLILYSGTYYYSNFSTPDTGYALAIPPPVPTGLTASDGTYTNKVSLSWNDVVGDGGYQVYRSTVNNSATAAWLGLVGANVTNFNDTSATPGTNYYYWVRSLVLYSGTYSYSNFCTPDTGYALAIPPPVPTGMTASDGTYTNKVSLSWNDVTGDGGYQVYRSTANNSATAPGWAWSAPIRRVSTTPAPLPGPPTTTGCGPWCCIPGLTLTVTSARPTRATPWRSRRRSPLG